MRDENGVKDPPSFSSYPGQKVSYKVIKYDSSDVNKIVLTKLKKNASNIDIKSLNKIVNVDSSEIIFNKNEIVLDDLDNNEDSLHNDNSALSKNMDISDSGDIIQVSVKPIIKYVCMYFIYH